MKKQSFGIRMLIANGRSLANEIEIDSFPKVFEKKLTFRQLYTFLNSLHVCAKTARIYYYYRKKLPRPIRLHRQTMYNC